MNRLLSLIAVGVLVATAGCGTTQRIGGIGGGLGGNMTAGAQANWGTNATEHRGSVGQRFAYNCPPGGAVGAVWGAEVYSDDSSVCTAGVHAGAISLTGGGRVVIEIRPGQSSYRAANWNGVQSQEWGAWEGSFVVVNN